MDGCYRRVHDRGYEPSNLDLIVHADAPRMSPHKKAIAGCIAELVGLPVDCVSVKAKTNEGMGPRERPDGIACTAAVLLTKKST